MSNSGIKISALENTGTIPEGGEVAIAVGGNISQTFGATLTALRSALLFENAYTTVALGIKGTSNGDIFFVYSDTDKSHVLGYTNVNGISATALNDDSGTQVRYGTYIALKNGTGDGDGNSSDYIDWVYNNGSAKGGENTIVLDTECLDVKAGWIGGSRQFKTLNFTFDVGSQTITLADTLEGGELVVFEVLPTFGTNTVDPDISNYINVSWVYNEGSANGGEVTITPPWTFQTVPAVYLNGARQVLGYHYELNGQSGITLATALVKGDFLQLILGGEETQLVADITGSATDVLNTLGESSGANKIGSPNSGYVSDYINFVSVTAFGATADYDPSTQTGTDNTKAFQAAIDYAIANKIYNVQVPSGYFLITGEVNLSGTNYKTGVDSSGNITRDVWTNVATGASLVGAGILSTNIIFNPSAQDDVCFSIRLGWGTSSRRSLSGMSILPFDPTNISDTAKQTDVNGCAIKIQGACFNYISDIYIGRFHRGVWLHNQDANDFTEFTDFRNLRIFYCDIGVDIHTTLGDNSFHKTDFDNSCQIQVREYGGIGIRIWDDQGRGTASYLGQYIATPYNSNWFLSIFGPHVTTKGTSYAIWMKNGILDKLGGSISAEGYLTIYADNWEYIRSNAFIRSASQMTYEINNTTITSSTPVDQFQWASSDKFCSNQVTADGVDTYLNETTLSYNPPFYYAPRVLRIGGTSASKGAIDGTAFINITGDRIGWVFGQKAGYTGTYSDFRSSFYISWNGARVGTPLATSLTLFHSAASFSLDGNGNLLPAVKTQDLGSTTYPWRSLQTVDYSFVSGAIAPKVNNVDSLGTTSLWWTGIYLNNWTITSSGILPRATATSNIGSSTLTVNNLFLQNAATVVSDGNLKPVQEALTDTEITCGRAMLSLFKKYKLSSAIDEKGENSARYHFGVISQEVISTFTANGLDYNDYGVITTDTTRQAVTVNDDGTYTPVSDSVLPVNEDGTITMISGIDSLEQDGDVVSIVRTINLVRYEELHSFCLAAVNAWMDKVDAFMNSGS